VISADGRGVREHREVGRADDLDEAQRVGARAAAALLAVGAAELMADEVA
jgi:hypothetical protein